MSIKIHVSRKNWQRLGFLILLSGYFTVAVFLAWICGTTLEGALLFMCLYVLTQIRWYGAKEDPLKEFFENYAVSEERESQSINEEEQPR